MDKKTAFPILLIILAGSAFFWQSFLSEKILLQNDALNFFYMEKQLQANALKQLEFPLWSPIVYSGAPLLANSQAALFYPTNIMLFFLPAEQATWLLQPISMVVAGISMFFFSKKIGLNNFAALVAAIAFMASGQMIARIFAGHLTLIATYSLIPLVFWSIENALEKKNAVSFIIVGISLALQFFAGFAQLFYFSLLFAAIFAAFRIRKGTKKKNIAFGVLTTIVVFVSLSAVQLFPSIELAGQMTRAGRLSIVDQASFSMPLAVLAEAILPNAFGNPANHTFWGEPYYWEFTPFIGTTVLLLAFFGIALNRKNKAVLLFFAIAMVSLLLALGKNIPFFEFSIGITSGFGMFRAPARILAIYCFAMALLAGFGAQAIFQADKKDSGKILRITAIAAALFLFATIALFAFNGLLKEKAAEFIEQKFAIEGIERISYLKSRVPSAIGLLENDTLRASTALFLLCLAVAMKQKKHEKKTIGLLVLAVFFELFLFSQVFLEPKTPKSVFEKTQEIFFLEKQPEPFRIISFSRDKLPQYLSAKFGIERADGYDPTVLKNYAELAGLIDKAASVSYDITFAQGSEIDLQFLGLLNVKFLVSESGLKENPLFLPRAFVVGKAKAVEAGKALEEMAKQNFDAKETVLLETGEKIENLQAAFFSPAVFQQISPEKIRIETKTSHEGFLAVSIPFYPGWKAKIDGSETTIFKANHALMAIKMPKGKHDTELLFEPDSFKAGLLVTIASVLVIACFFSRKRKKKAEKKMQPKKEDVWKKKIFEEFYSIHFEKIKKHLPNLMNARVLEVGCQSAYFSVPFARAGAECHCIDNEKKELEKGKKLFKELGLKAKFMLMDGFDLKFADNSFDLVFNHGVIEHFSKQKQDKMLQEMKRVSKNLVYVSVPNKLHPHSANILKESLQKHETSTGFSWEREFHPFSFLELKSLFEKNNLQLLELFGSLHWCKKNKPLNEFLQKTIGLLAGFELCALGKKIRD